MTEEAHIPPKADDPTQRGPTASQMRARALSAGNGLAVPAAVPATLVAPAPPQAPGEPPACTCDTDYGQRQYGNHDTSCPYWLPPGAVLEQCRGACTQQMFFARQLKRDGSIGKPQPINWPRVPHAGHLVLLAQSAHDVVPWRPGDEVPETTLFSAATAEQKADSSLPRWTAHHSTCPDVKQFRR